VVCVLSHATVSKPWGEGRVRNVCRAADSPSVHFEDATEDGLINHNPKKSVTPIGRKVWLFAATRPVRTTRLPCRGNNAANTPTIPTTVSATGVMTRPDAEDQIEHVATQGPSDEVLAGADQVSSPDLDTEKRWPAYTARMRDHTAVRSVASFRLFTQGGTQAALTV
jgi:hypothetical protein